MARVDRGIPFSAGLALVLIVLAAIPRETTAGTSEASGPAPRGFRCGWPYPASLAPGTYTVKVGVFSVRPFDESRHFISGVDAALQHEASFRVSRQLSVIAGARCTEVSLGIDVHTNGFQDVVAIQRAQKRQSRELVQIIDAA